MSIYKQDGNVIDYINPSSTIVIHAGDVVVLPSRIGVAAADIPAGESGSVSISEGWEFATAAETIPIGSTVYWDAAAGAVTKNSTNNTRAGIAITAKPGNAVGVVTVRLE